MGVAAAGRAKIGRILRFFITRSPASAAVPWLPRRCAVVIRFSAPSRETVCVPRPSVADFEWFLRAASLRRAAEVRRRDIPISFSIVTQYGISSASQSEIAAGSAALALRPMPDCT